jgi:hypothetical protein
MYSQTTWYFIYAVLQPRVHAFEAVLFSRLDCGGAAGPPSTGTLGSRGHSEPQTQQVDTTIFEAYIRGKNCTWSLRGMAKSWLLLLCCCLVISPNTMLQLLQTLQSALLSTYIYVILRFEVLSCHHAGSKVAGCSHYSQFSTVINGFYAPEKIFADLRFDISMCGETLDSYTYRNLNACTITER